MSAFLVENETVVKVVALVDAFSADTGAFFDAVYVPDKKVPNVERQRHLRNVGQRLYAMNCEAMRQRYGVVEPMPMYQHRLYPLLSPEITIEAYKALRCLLYQCAEGDVPRTWDLYADIKPLAAWTAERIVESLQAYQAAPWR